MKIKNKNGNLKSFFILWITQSFSQLGSSVTSYALIIWVYRQNGTALSIALVALCYYLPSVLVSFFAGTLADRWDKKKIMLASDLLACLCTVTLWLLLSGSYLKIWHVYIINIILGLTNAFQSPASLVAVSLIADKKHYGRISGMQSFSSSLIKIITPVVAIALMSFWELNLVFIFDIVSFTTAFIVLLLFIKIPYIAKNDNKSSFFRSCFDGIKYIVKYKPLFYLIMLFAGVNLVSYMSDFSLRPALILARTGGDETILGITSTFVGIAMLLGGVFISIKNTFKNKINVIFISLILSFLFANALFAIGNNVYLWILAAILGYFPVPIISSNMTVIMRTKVPIEKQGIVFAARNSMQFFTIPIGLFLGGFLADTIFEPFMASDLELAHLLAHVLGTGKGSGIALIYLLCGIAGVCIGIIGLKLKILKNLNE